MLNVSEYASTVCKKGNCLGAGERSPISLQNHHELRPVLRDLFATDYSLGGVKVNKASKERCSPCLGSWRRQCVRLRLVRVMFSDYNLWAGSRHDRSTADFFRMKLIRRIHSITKSHSIWSSLRRIPLLCPTKLDSKSVRSWSGGCCSPAVEYC